MDTFIINNEKDLEKYKDEYGYHIQGNAKFNYSANLAGRLLVDGYLEVKVDEYIKAGGSIEAGEYIEVDEYIEAGRSYGILAGLQITCKGELTFGLKVFAGICTWREITDEERTITCSKINGGVVEYGILKETGEVQDDATKQAIELLKNNGYKIVKEGLLK